MTLYLLNTTIIDPDSTPLLIRVDEITVDEAKELLRDGFVSAVGHEATAQFLSMLFMMTIPINRIAVKLRAGDKAVCLKLQGRLPEGKILTLAEMKQVQYKLYLLTVQQAQPDDSLSVSKHRSVAIERTEDLMMLE
ncbi:MAG: YddF family protein [Candidatus Nitrosocaldus sp.]